MKADWSGTKEVLGPDSPAIGRRSSFVVRAIEAANLRPGDEMSLVPDVAATHFFDGSHYFFAATEARLAAVNRSISSPSWSTNFQFAASKTGWPNKIWLAGNWSPRIGCACNWSAMTSLPCRSGRLKQGIGARWPIAFSSS